MDKRRRHILSYSSRKSIQSFSSFHKRYWSGCSSTSCKTLFKNRKICLTLSAIRSSYWSILALSNRRFHFLSTKDHHGKSMPVHNLYQAVTLSSSSFLQMLKSSLPEYQTQWAKLTDTQHVMKIFRFSQSLSSHGLLDPQISWTAALSFTSSEGMAHCSHHNSTLPKT